MKTDIEIAAERCREAFKDVKTGSFAIHCHHDRFLELLTDDPENRIQYILSDKPEHERVERLNLFRPLKSEVSLKLKEAQNEYIKAYNKSREAWTQEIWVKYEEAWDKYAEINTSPKMLQLHKEICNCNWSEKTDIFNKEQ